MKTVNFKTTTCRDVERCISATAGRRKSFSILNFQFSILIALAIGLAMNACVGGGKTNDTGNATGQSETQSVNEPAPPATAPKPEDWKSSDFKLEVDYSNASMGTVHYTITRRGDEVDYIAEGAGMKTHYLYRLEDGKVYSYTLSPQAKKASRKLDRATTLEAMIKRQTELHVSSTPVPSEQKLAKSYEKTGEETVGGIACDVYVQKKADTSELEALASALGKGQDVEKLKKAADGLSTTCWIDRQKRLVARIEVTGTKLVGNWAVSSFRQGNISADEIPDISGYTVQ
jgi:hypothetical protein